MGGLIIEVDHAIERISGFLLALEDIDQQNQPLQPPEPRQPTR